MRVPQKIKNFMWRACCNAMLTKQALVKRTIISDPSCDRCSSATESPLHALWSCSEIDVVWADRNHSGFSDFKQLVSWIVEEGKHIELFAFTVWAIWNQRNQVRVRAPAVALHHVAEIIKYRIACRVTQSSFINMVAAPSCELGQDKLRRRGVLTGKCFRNRRGGQGRKWLGFGFLH
ncbi:hypothetical protein SO802_008176 [Lithocarpus litseifolius]|uniref:Reverse transcriptase zinc-binding domain-containing protein n=1 Tax=Lithocarpus litseifolius TaxID=425828 RepID=A0AAW2D8R8_9ROSI